MNDSLNKTIFAEIDAIIKGAEVVLFMKGTKDEPRCGFSAFVVQALNNIGVDFEAYDVLDREELRQGIKEYSDWPTIPQLYIGGEFIGGCDIVKEMLLSGELVRLLKK